MEKYYIPLLVVCFLVIRKLVTPSQNRDEKIQAITEVENETSYSSEAKTNDYEASSMDTESTVEKTLNEVPSKNKWLYTDDNFGKMERGRSL